MQNNKQRITGRNHPSRLARLPLAVAICFAINPAAFAQEGTAPAPEEAGTKNVTPTLATVTVTAQKRSENLQKVPISMQVLSSAKLEQQNVTDFDDYAKLLPSVSFDRGESGGSAPYMRGVASGENSNHSGPLPSVGVYLDEQPVTTIGGVLDVHIYDIERVEALAGPQGTLYGASSEAGTLRIISKKPDASAFAAGYALEANSVSHGGTGYVAEGFVNIPISPAAAIRLVGWDKRDAGYIDNVFGTRTFPGWDAASGGQGTIDNAAFARKNYNDVQTAGARAALKIDINDNWSVTPALLTQSQTGHGNFASDPVVGDLAIRKFYPEGYKDRFTQSALTVQGKIGNFDLTYAYTHLNRHISSDADYSDYSFWYDAYYQDHYSGLGLPNTFADIWVDDNGNFINPSQLIHGEDGYRKTSHELRIASPKENRLRFIGGVFWQQQSHKIFQNYYIAGGLNSATSVTGWPSTLWLTNQMRRDHDEAFFGELSFDITDKLTATGGLRFYSYDNSLKGFFGFGAGYSGSYGEALCFSPEQFQGSPCVNLDDQVDKNGRIGRFNLTYKINDTKMIYGTWSKGFRPGGINRNNQPPNPPTYQPDFLTNLEFGWKTSWLDNRVVFNGAIFQENWEDMQFSFIPPGGSGLTIIRNAGGSRIRGLETELNWAATYKFQVSGGLSLYDAKLTTDYCGFNDATTGEAVTYCPPGTVIAANDPADPTDDEVVTETPAPKGTRLPVSARFKGNLTGRYSFELGTFDAYWQGVVSHEGGRRSYLALADSATYGDLDSYTLFDFSAGIKKNNWALDFYIKNVFDERADLARYSQCVGFCVQPGLVSEYPNGQRYVIHNQPRTIGVRFSQEF